MTPPAPHLLVVIPAWNEEECVAQVVKEVRTALAGADIVVVDDGSTDRTADVARSAGASVLSLPFHLGVGGAMRAGYRYASLNGYDAAVQIDADGQHDPKEVELLLEHLGPCDVVVGARFAGRGDYRVGGPRRWAMHLLALVVSRVAGTRLTDVTSGFRASNRRAIDVFARDYPLEYLGDTVESLVIAARAGCTVGQVPVTMRPRVGGSPSQSVWKATVYLLRAMLVLLLAVIRRHETTARERRRQDER